MVTSFIVLLLEKVCRWELFSSYLFIFILSHIELQTPLQTHHNQSHPWSVGLIADLAQPLKKAR